MTYIENVFLCMASPLLIAALCMGKRQRKFFLFCFAGMGVCLLSAYINTFFAALYKADTFAATTEIAPVVEEVMKLLPLLFYLLILIFMSFVKRIIFCNNSCCFHKFTQMLLPEIL